MRKVRSILLAMLIMCLMLSFTTLAANASIKKTVGHKTKIEKSKELKAHGEKAIKKEKKGESAEKESAWRIMGWETIFALLAVGFYVSTALYLLPKIAAKELGGHH